MYKNARVCMHERMRVSTSKCRYIHALECVFNFMNAHVCIYVYMHAHVPASVHMLMCACVRTSARACRHVCVRVCMN